MSKSLWHQQGETFSHKNACKEFGLTEVEIFEAMKVGKLQYQENCAHGNPYFRLLRIEVKALALDLHGSKALEEQDLKHKLKKVNTEINSFKRKIKALEKQKIELLTLQQQAKA